MNKKLTLATLVLALLAMGLASQALSQTAPPEPAVEAPKIDIAMRPRELTDVPLNDPRPIDLVALKVPGAAANLTDGVTVKAYTRYVTFEGKTIGQVVLVGVAKSGRQEALPTNAYAAQIDLTEPRLDPAQEIVIKGDSEALLAALRRLQETKPQEVAQETVINKETTSAQGNGSSNQGNSQAAGWQAPAPIKVTPEPEETIRVTSEGCPIRVDLEQGKAIQQSKQQTLKGGAVTDESACTDSNQGYELKRSYTVCTDDVNMEARTATARFALYYIDGGGARQEVNECGPDGEKVFPIVENFQACTMSLDYTKFEAVPQSSLIYRDDNNVEVQVRGCQASDTKPPVEMTRTLIGCSIRHDFQARKSHQQGMWTYLFEGIQYNAGGCVDTGVEYSHTRLYEDAAGKYICSPIVDLTGGTATLQSRLRITVDGMGQYITECTPDTSGQLAVLPTTIGCDNPMTWEHDLTAGQSYGKERYYFLKNGLPEYVTQCQRSSDIYTHQVETTGWQNHDDQLFAYPLTTIYITPPSGRTDVSVSQVQSGATQMPYELTGNATSETGVNTYEGCSKFAQTQEVETYKRPDLTTYEKVIGPGPVVGPTDVCVTTVVGSQNLATGLGTVRVGGQCIGRHDNWGYVMANVTYFQTVNKIDMKNTETGQVVSTTCEFANGSTWDGWYTQGSQYCGGGGGKAQTLFVGPQYTPPCPF